MNPLHPTSMGSHLARHPLLRHSSTSSVYLALFLSLASSMQSSQGTVSSKRMTCSEASEISTRSGLSDVMVTVSGNFSCLPRSTFSSQSCTIANRPEEVVRAAAVGFFPTLAEVMVFFTGRRHLQWLIPLQMVSAMAFRTWSWHQR